MPEVSSPAPVPNPHVPAPNASSSREYATETPRTYQRKPTEVRTCVSCFSVGCSPTAPLNGWPVLLAVPCGHVFCKPCIAKRCSLGLTDRSLVPAHCCGKEFPTEYVKDALKSWDFQTYSRFLRERQWINSTLLSDVEYAAMIKREGGMQCPSCGIGVMKISGCEHMRCYCGKQFNYKC